MKFAATSMVRALLLRIALLAVFSCLFSALFAAMGSLDRDAALADDEPFTLTLSREAMPAIADELPCEATPSVSFAVPVVLPSSLSRPSVPVAPPPAAAPVEDETMRMLRAIAEVESRGNPRRVGRLGERGLYQFRRDTWRQHTREHFTRAHHPGVATAVARRHYHWIRRQLQANGRQATPYEVALAWNAGVTNVISGRAPARAHGYAQRVVNLAGRS